MGSHSVTCRSDIPAFIPPEAGTRFSNLGGMQGWVDLGDWLEMVYPHNGHPSWTNRARCWLTSLMQPTTLTTTSSRHPFLEGNSLSYKLLSNESSVDTCNELLPNTGYSGITLAAKADISTLRWAVLTGLGIGFCHTWPIFAVRRFIFVYFVCFCFILHMCCIIVSTVGWTRWD